MSRLRLDLTVVTTIDVNLRSAPSEDAEVLTILGEGVQLEVTSAPEDGWIGVATRYPVSLASSATSSSRSCQLPRIQVRDEKDAGCMPAFFPSRRFRYSHDTLKAISVDALLRSSPGWRLDTERDCS